MIIYVHSGVVLRDVEIWGVVSVVRRDVESGNSRGISGGTGDGGWDCGSGGRGRSIPAWRRFRRQSECHAREEIGRKIIEVFEERYMEGVEDAARFTIPEPVCF